MNPAQVPQTRTVVSPALPASEGTSQACPQAACNSRSPLLSTRAMTRLVQKIMQPRRVARKANG